MFSEQTFAEIRTRTNGYLKPKVYESIYRAAMEAPPGIVIDIGPAQGASTISLGLGRREAGLLTRIYSIDMFRSSNALVSKTDVSLNIQTLRTNVDAYELGAAVRILQVGRDDPAKEIPREESIAIMFIDADGALDRDFSQFYDSLVPGASVILDDFKLKYSDAYLEFSDAKIAQYTRNKGVARFRDVVPLGKHYTVYRFVNYFVDEGLLEVDRLVDNTAFCHKPQQAPAFDTVGRLQRLEQIREEIEAEYWDRRKKRRA